MYLLENGHEAFLYVDKLAPPQLIQVCPYEVHPYVGRPWRAPVPCTHVEVHPCGVSMWYTHVGHTPIEVTRPTRVNHQPGRQAVWLVASCR